MDIRERHRTAFAGGRLGEEADFQRRCTVEHEVADQEPMATFQRIVQGDDIACFCHLVKDGIAGDRGGVTIVRDAFGDDADDPMLPGIVFLKTKFYPIEAVGLQNDSAAVPFACKDVMDGSRKDEIAVGNKK